MTRAQVVDVRSGIPRHVPDEEAFLIEVEQLRAKLQPGQYCIAPMCEVVTRDGRLRAGAVITIDMLLDEVIADARVADPAAMLASRRAWTMERLVREGRVVARY